MVRIATWAGAAFISLWIGDADASGCGFQASADSAIIRSEGAVPILLGSKPLTARAEADFLRRRAHPSNAKKVPARCAKTEQYLHSVLNRLISSSNLGEFSKQKPALKMVVQCTRPDSLPVARASAGRILLVPAGLPALAESEDAIAAVLAHELAHLTLRHTERLMSLLHGGAAGSREKMTELKRSHEREADITGLKILVNAGYDPEAAVDHLKSVDQLATARGVASQRKVRPRGLHDPLQSRIELLTGQIRMCGYAPASKRFPVAPEVVSELRILSRRR